MTDFLHYILQEVKSKRLSKTEALHLLRQFHQGAADAEVPDTSHTPAPETTKNPPEVESRYGTLLLTGAWKPIPLVPSGSAPTYTRHLVMTCESSHLAGDSAALLKQNVEFIDLRSEKERLDLRFEDQATRVFSSIRRILNDGTQGPVLIQVVVRLHEEQRLFAAIAGLLRTARLENPRLRGQVICFDTDTRAEALPALLEENSRVPDDDLVYYRQGARWTFAWQEAATSQENFPWEEHATYLITGGAGALGLLMAREIAGRLKNVNLVLAGRSSLHARAQAQITELEANGAHVAYRLANVSRMAEVEYLLRSISQEFGNLRGIIHSAGIIHDNFIIKKSEEELHEVLAPKVAGLFNLDLATRQLPLDFFLLFSSNAAVTGNSGQADYAVANAFLDQYAEYRNELVAANLRHGRTLSINWPLWKDGGMRVNDESLATLKQRRGMIPMTTADGLQAFYRAWATGAGHVRVLMGEMDKLREELLPRTLSSAPPALSPHPATASLPLLREAVMRQLKTLFASIIKLTGEEIDAEAALETYGIDSLIITKLNQKLAGIFEALSQTLFYEYPTLSAIADYLVTEHIEGCVAWAGLKNVAAAPSAAAAEWPTDREAARLPRFADFAADAQNIARESREPIAIIGVSGRYPGAANLQEFWENLAAGRDCIVEIPEERWTLDGFYEPDRAQALAQGKSYSKWGGFLENFASFDSLFFNISPREALLMDPQERLFLESCWEVLEDAGYTRDLLAKRHHRRVGIFAGITKTGYALHGPELWKAGKRLFPSTSFSSVTSRASYFLGLKGPSLPVDTMCSSSLTAIHEACEHLHRGDCELAIAGGVNLYLHPANYIALCQHNMLSTDGLCRSFAHGANGFVPGEGVGCVLLKPLSRALADSDRIVALIRATSINHGGKTNGYTVPNPASQKEVIRAALERANVPARAVSYLEAHGTGTELGDPVELTGLTQAFEQETSEHSFCALGSVKSNIGHLEAAAGIAGLTKVILQLKHRRLAPSLHASKRNSNLDFERTPFSLQQSLSDWKRPLLREGEALKEWPRIAGISSFGAGGVNAHIIVEEYLSDEGSSDECRSLTTGSRLFLLSAKNPDRLRSYAARLLAFIEAGEVDLADLTYTLQIGREAMEERLALVVSSQWELAQKLHAYLENRTDIEGFHRGRVERSRETLTRLSADEDMREMTGKWMRAGKFANLAALWIDGLEIDWYSLYGVNRPKRISLPTYPFASERYWIPDLLSGSGEASAMASAFYTSASQDDAMRDGSVMRVPKADVREEPRTFSSGEAATDERLEDYVKRWIREELSLALNLRADALDDQSMFADYGLDSILGVRFIHQLNESLGLDLATTAIFDHSSVNRLTVFITSQYGPTLFKHAAARPEEPDEDTDSPFLTRTRSCHAEEDIACEPSQENISRVYDAAKESIAIIGMSGRFAGSDTLDQLWEHLAAGRDLVQNVTRWNVAEPLSHASHEMRELATDCNDGSFLDEIDKFDPLFFNISGVEAAYMDPQQRVFLEESWKALEDAGYAGQAVEGRDCGVYVGCCNGDYHELMSGDTPAQALWGNMASMIPARISYYANLKGPSIAVDTSCSSSLVAIHLACDDLRAGRTSLALAGGIFIQTTPKLYRLANRAHMLSASGRCYTFDERADGFVPGEGVGVLVLKRLEEALADRDHIYGVIKGSGVNQDGSTNGITAPSALSQERLLRQVYDSFEINPESISLVEAHGTATKLGDPIEFKALASAFGAYTQQKAFCALGSLKTNLGHTQFAAGVAGVIKVLLALKHRQIPPALNFRSSGEGIRFEDSPFYINQQLQDWKPTEGTVLRAAVSSFGASGTNAHLVIEEAPATKQRSTSAPAYLVVLSARTDEQLRQQVRQLLEYCERNGTVDCGGLSYTLMQGRKHFSHRFACVVRQREELREALKSWLDGEGGARTFSAGPEDVPRPARSSLKRFGQECLQRCRSLTDLHEYLENLLTIAELFVQGYVLAYDELFEGATYSRLSLPTYPFARERYWLPQPPASNTRRPEPGQLHPLVHRNTSTLAEQRFTTTFSGREDFLRDHIVQGKPILPGVAHLEMARAALAMAIDEAAVERTALRFQDVVWAQPLWVEDSPVNVQLGLYPQDDGSVAFSIYRQATVSEAVASGTTSQVFSQGRLDRVPLTQPPLLNLQTLKAECRTTLPAGWIYEALKAVGIEHGSSLRGIEEVHVGAGLVMAKLFLPAPTASALGQCMLHPALLDSAIQASMGLNWRPDEESYAGSPALPFALDELQVIAPSAPNMWAVIRSEAKTSTPDKLARLDIDLCDELGVVCVRMKGYSSRFQGDARRPLTETHLAAEKNVQSAELAVHMLVPVWEAVPVADAPRWPAAGETILIAGGTTSEREAILQDYPMAAWWELKNEETIERIAEKLELLGSVDHIIWLATDAERETTMAEALIQAQESGVLACFRLVKALLRCGYDERTLGLTVITRQSQPIDAADSVHPAHAALHGFIGALAKEFPLWQVRLLDLETGGAWPGAHLFALPADAGGDASVHRMGQWHRRRLIPLGTSGTVKRSYREGGVYVVVGGAGGVGYAWSEYMIRAYGAKIIWLGRRQPDALIQGRLDALAQIGSAPLYLVADATDRMALTRAYHAIKERYSRINGVVHSAIVLQDQSLARMDEERFRAVLRAKVDTSVHITQVFGEEPLDFVLFFSSIQSFTKSQGQSNYAAGCTFKDAFAQNLARRSPYSVKVINWGYWGSLGVVSSPFYREKMAKAGLGALEPSEGMQALELLLSGPLEQMALVKTTRPDVLEGIDAQETLKVYTESLPSVVQNIGGDFSDGKTLSDRLMSDRQWQTHERDALLVRVLWAQLRSLGLFKEAHASVSDIYDKVSGGVHLYERWLEESFAILVERNYLQRLEGSIYKVLERSPVKLEEVWDEWADCMAAWLKDPDKKGQMRLAEATLVALPQILTGKVSSTDIIFPKGSMELVESVYSNNLTADYFNGVLADMAAAYLRERVGENRLARIRILEIGAGTGATSAAVFSKLEPYRERIEEYCYTDISKAFLLHAQKTFVPHVPYLSYRLFNVEEPLHGQEVEPGAFDLVIAANVLHATRNIRHTLRQAKAALKHRGCLLLNELSGKDLFSHVTFGLLKGWWLYADAALRVQGTPALLPDTWQRILESEGFRPLFFPVAEAHQFGQQIIVAESDGLVRQKQQRPSEEGVAHGRRAARLPESASSLRPHTGIPAQHTSQELLKAQTTSYLQRVIGTTLQIPTHLIEKFTPLDQYGIDSILSIQLTNALRKDLGQVSTTLLFEVEHIDALAEHLIRNKKEKLIEVLNKVHGTRAERSSNEIQRELACAAQLPLTYDPERFAPQRKKNGGRPSARGNGAHGKGDAGFSPHALNESTSSRLIPLSEGQKGLWLLHELTPGTAAYNVPFAFRIDEVVDVTALRNACRFVLDQYPILGAVLREADGVQYQLISDERELCFQHEQIEHQESVDIVSYLRERAKEPFKLEQGPLMRVHLFSCRNREKSETILLITIHHLVFDGTSSGLLLDCLERAYRVYLRGEEPELIRATTTYSDFVEWEQELLKSDAGREHLDYWKRTLSGTLPILALPFDYSRARASQGDGATLQARMRSDLAVPLRLFAKSQQTSLAVLFLALYKMLLHRYTSQQELIVGMPTSGRHERKFQDVMGYFVNLMPIRSHLSPEQTFLELLKSLRQTLTEGLGHAAYPFPALLRDLKLNQQRGFSPVFQTVFAYQNFSHAARFASPAQTSSALLTRELFEGIHQEGEYELALEIFEENDEFKLNLKYDPTRFEAATVERMMAHYLNLAQEVLKSPDLPITRYTLLSEAERNEILSLNPPAQHSPDGPCLHKLFEEQARQTPSSIAVVFEDDSFTYGELNERANRVAHYLRKAGIGPECVVGIFMERSLEMMVALLGIFKAGGAYLPLDPASPKERLEFMLADAETQILLTQKHLLGLLPATRARIVSLDGEWEVIALESAEQPFSDVCPENLAYVIYTSGSTGSPKGVAVEHRQLSHYVRVVTNRLDFTSSSSFATVSTLTADLGHTAIYPALCSGGTLHLIEAERALDAVALGEYFSRHEIDCLKIVPSHLSALLASSQDGQVLPRQRLVLGGEATHWEMVQTIQRLTPQCRIFNHYGPTETTVGVLIYGLGQSPVEGLSATLPLGRPLAHTEVYVLDEWLRPVPAGVAGEIYIGGQSLTRGYFNRPTQTAEKFIPHPFSKQGGERLYRTGDRGRHLPDGNIEFLGRVDEQIKIRGYRVELGEIESVLARHKAVRECVVIAREDKGGEQRLVGYIVPWRGASRLRPTSAGQYTLPKQITDDSLVGTNHHSPYTVFQERRQSVDARPYKDGTDGTDEAVVFDERAEVALSLFSAELLRHARSTLPEYMVPTALVILDELPLTRNGKIDRRALPPPPDLHSERGQTDERLHTPVEEVVLGIWAEALQLERMRAADNFFDAGGHSLLAVRVISRIREAFRVAIPLRTLFEHPILTDFAERIEIELRKEGRGANRSLRQHSCTAHPDER